MSEHREIYWKLQHAALPVAAAALIFSITYSGLAWLVEWLWLPLDEAVVRYWLPSGLAFLLALLLVRPHLRRFDFDPEKANSFWFYLVATAAICVPCFLMQSYLRDVTAELVPVNSVAEISGTAHARYFQSQNVCLDRSRAVAHPALDRNLKSGRPERYVFYVAAPVCDASDVWIGFRYSKSIDSAATDQDLQEGFKAFGSEVERRFNAEDPSSFRYLERLGRSSDYRNYQKALQDNGKSGDGLFVLKPHTEPFAPDAGNDAMWFAIAYGVGMLLWFSMVLLKPLDPDKPAEPDADEKLQSLIASQFYLPRRHHYGAAVLVDLNIAVFAVMLLSGLGVFSFERDDLIAWGANYGPLDHGLGLLRLVTSQFVHSGVMHLFNNMYGLIFACLFLMPVVKNGRLIFCYLLCGTIGSIASVTMHPQTPSVGASGAILGLWGILLVLSALRDKRLENPKGILINIAIYTALTLGLGAVTPGVDNFAHIGGLVAGLVLGLVLFVTNGMKRSPAEEAA